MLVRELVRCLEEIAPTRYAESWDNVGLLAGDPGADATRVLFTIDFTRAVADEAFAARADVVVAYHPPIFAAMKRLPHDAPVVEAVRRGVALYSPHTALDAAPGGTNDVLADVCGVLAEGRAPLRPAAAKDAEHKLVTFVPANALGAVSEALFAAGAGRIGRYSSCSFRSPGTGTFFGEEGAKPVVGRAGELEEAEEVRLETVVPIARVAEVVAALRAAHPYEEPAFDLVRLAAAPPSGFGMGRVGEVASTTREALVARVREGLGAPHVLVAGPRSGKVERVAVCAGAGGDMWQDAAAHGADVYVTGEVRHHDALAAAARGMTVIAALHSQSERVSLTSLEQRVREACARAGGAIETIRSTKDADPFVVT